MCGSMVAAARWWLPSKHNSHIRIERRKTKGKRENEGEGEEEEVPTVGLRRSSVVVDGGGWCGGAMRVHVKLKQGLKFCFIFLVHVK